MANPRARTSSLEAIDIVDGGSAAVAKVVDRSHNFLVCGNFILRQSILNSHADCSNSTLLSYNSPMRLTAMLPIFKGKLDGEGMSEGVVASSRTPSHGTSVRLAATCSSALFASDRSCQGPQCEPGGRDLPRLKGDGHQEPMRRCWSVWI